MIIDVSMYQLGRCECVFSHVALSKNRNKVDPSQSSREENQRKIIDDFGIEINGTPLALLTREGPKM